MRDFIEEDEEVSIQEEKPFFIVYRNKKSRQPTT
jgi:hypothetical protein